MLLTYIILMQIKLWPLFGGIMTKPEKGKLFYIPQVRITNQNSS